jgi:hypothetical protein
MTRGQRRDEDRTTRVLVRARRFDGLRADFRRTEAMYYSARHLRLLSSDRQVSLRAPSTAAPHVDGGFRNPASDTVRTSTLDHSLEKHHGVLKHCTSDDVGTQFVARCRDPEGRQSPPAPTPADGPPNAPPTARKPESRPCLAQPLLRPGHLRPMRRNRLAALQARRDLHPGRLPLGTFEDRVQHGVLRPR